MAPRPIHRLFLLAFAVTSPVFAFTGPEHRDISNLALEMALHQASPSLRPELVEEIASIYLSGHRLQPDSPGPKKPEHRTFGDLVAALDYFQDPDRLVEGSDPYENFWRRIGKRRFNLFSRLWALHTNELHFQGDAARTYTEHHRRAVFAALAAQEDPGKLHEALLEEAVALHFLEDFFAAGHIATPRTGWADLPAGTLHDRFNREGLPFRVKETEPSAGEAPRPFPGLALLRAWLEQDPAPAADESTYSITVEDLQRFEDRQRGPGPPWDHFGDGRLKDSTAQQIFLLAVAARSLNEVLATLASNTLPEESLQFCFFPRTALPGPRPPSKLRELLGLTSDGDDEGKVYRNILLKDSLEPPQGGLRLRSWQEAGQLFEGCQDENGWWGRYVLNGVEDLNLTSLRTTGLGLDLRQGRTGGGRQVFASHLDLILISTLPKESIRHRQEALDHGLERAQALGSSRSILGHYGLAFLDGPDFDAWGLHLGGYIPFPERHLQLSYWTGYATYHWAGGHSTKVHYGLQIGLDLLFGHANLGIERLYVPGPGGSDLDGDFLYTAGFQTQVPLAWLRRLRK